LTEDHGASLEVPITNSFLEAISFNNFEVVEALALAVDVAAGVLALAVDVAGVLELVGTVAFLLPQPVAIEINVTNAIINIELRMFFILPNYHLKPFAYRRNLYPSTIQLFHNTLNNFNSSSRVTMYAYTFSLDINSLSI
jgi:hypothetical protein